ncbi:MAG: hypothetical protein QME84_05475 [Actinomycetota bacterium]|nr:hypothetical protein [Actinomycetota bacterium]
MKIVVIEPRKVILAGALSCLLLAGSILGVLCLAGLFRGERARAYGTEGVGSRTWYFPEGYTGPGFEEYILIFNPHPDVGGTGKVAFITLGYYGPNGMIGFNYLQLEPGQRASVNVKHILKEKYNYEGDVSVVVGSWANEATIICERAMYFHYPGGITGGSQSLGYTEAEAPYVP